VKKGENDAIKSHNDIVWRPYFLQEQYRKMVVISVSIDSGTMKIHTNWEYTSKILK
jgi:hypothetical protein